MNVQTFARVDKATFYRFVERHPDGRYEYVRGRIMQQMTGGTLKHSQVSKRFLRTLDNSVDPVRWIANGSDRGVETHVTIRYPDVSVEPIGADPESLATLCPAVIVEVMSRHSEDSDMFVKPSEYLGIATLEVYIIASQNEAVCFVYRRGTDGEFPEEPEVIQGEDNVIDIPALSLSIPLADIYRGLIPPSAPADAAKTS